MGSSRVAVVGGSIAGLFTALLLRRRGWSVAVYERATEPLSGRGAGIVTHPALDRVLARAGIARPDDFGIEVTRRTVLDRNGSVTAIHPCRQTMTSWDRLWRLLRDALPDADYHPGVEFAAVAQHADSVQIRFADGRTADADLLVGADGLRSAVRAAAIGDVPPRYAGYAAWRGLLAESHIPPAAHAALFADFAFCLPDGEQMLGYPVAGPHDDLRPGHRRYNWVWYRPADLPDLLTDSQGHVHAISIPPPLIRPAMIRAMQDAAHAVLAPEFAAIVAATATPFLQPIYDLESPRLAAGRIALVGDAAFVARPHVGAGTTKAAEDAAALADALAADPIIPALARYEALRRPAGQRILRRARHLGAYLQAERTDEERAAADRHRTAQAVLEETAILDF